MRFLSDLVGTLASYFRIAGLRLSNSSDTAIEIRNKAGTELRDLRARAVALRLAAGTNAVKIALAGEPAGDVNLTFPAADGATNQVLATDGAGALYWATVALGTDVSRTQEELVTYSTSSPHVIFTPPANARIVSVAVEVETAWDGSGASMSVGVSGDTARYMGATEVDLATAATYEVEPRYEEDGTPEQIVATIAPGSGASAGVARITVSYTTPG